jgi:hypothetical protein
MQKGKLSQENIYENIFLQTERQESFPYNHLMENTG